jgi:hypothetical protein
MRVIPGTCFQSTFRNWLESLSVYISSSWDIRNCVLFTLPHRQRGSVERAILFHHLRSKANRPPSIHPGTGQRRMQRGFVGQPTVPINYSSLGIITITHTHWHCWIILGYQHKVTIWYMMQLWCYMLEWDLSHLSLLLQSGYESWLDSPASRFNVGAGFLHHHLRNARGAPVHWMIIADNNDIDMILLWYDLSIS